MLRKFFKGPSKVTEDRAASPSASYEPSWGVATESGEYVTVESSQSIATAYRAKNIISDSVAIMPLKHYHRVGRATNEVQEDPVTRNLAYLLQVSPNLWGWTPFQLKKAVIEWLLFYGNGYVWKPPVSPAQLFVLPADRTRPMFDLQGNLWYEHYFSSSDKPSYIPSVEILHLLINPDETGMMGRGVITFARETFGRRIAAANLQGRVFSQGFMPAAYMKFDGDLSKEMRDKVRSSYEESMSGSANAYRLAIFDRKVTEYKPIDIHLADAQFLESISATDDDIALFFGIAGHMLNRGKEAYNSNVEKWEEFKTLTIDPLVVPWEEAARVRWLSSAEQGSDYFKFKREALYRMNPKERADMNSTKIQSGQLSPNEARAMEELDPYPLGDEHFMNSGVQPIRMMMTPPQPQPEPVAVATPDDDEGEPDADDQ